MSFAVPFHRVSIGLDIGSSSVKAVALRKRRAGWSLAAWGDVPIEPAQGREASAPESAVIGAAITMYASVASRTAEIGTLRALGFSRGAILTAFLGEALLLGLLGGVVGLIGASMMQALSISTTNFQTFAEIAFSFTLTPGIVAISLAFSLAMGFVGGFLPAARAAQMKIVDALRAA